MNKYQSESSFSKDAGGRSVMITATYTQFWLLAALALVMFEMGAPGLFYSLSLAFGAVGASVVAYCGYALQVQLASFLVIAICSIWFLRYWIKNFNRTDLKNETNMYALKGKIGTVVKVGDNMFPQVKLNGQIWSAQVTDGQVLEVGMLVKVKNVTGVKLLVTVEK